MQRKDYYRILGVARDADEGEIKIAYRKLALVSHPDTNRDDPGAEDRFKEINEAYDVLSHRGKRNQYDLGHDPIAGAPPARPSMFETGCAFEPRLSYGSGCRGGGFGQILGRKRPGFRRGSVLQPVLSPYRPDLQVQELSLTSDEALRGAERDIRFHTGRNTLVFTVSIPAGVEHGAIFGLKRFVGIGREVELLFRVTISK